MDLDDLHRERLIADEKLEELERKYDAHKQFIEDSVDELVLTDLSRVKAEAQVKVSYPKQYKEYCDARRDYHAKEREVGRLKSKYYHTRDREGDRNAMDREAGRR